MKKIFVITLFFVKSITLISQAGDFNDHKKYWYYRTKLNNDFVKVGCSVGGEGESLPFNQRARYANDNLFQSSDMAMGDELSTLGIYIGVLATEYKLLADNHEDTRKVCHELFCALNAVNRLDYNAETHLGCGSGSLNGFLMRDDMPPNFLFNNYKHFNYFNTWDGSSFTFEHSGVDNDVFKRPTSYAGDFGFASMAQKGQYECHSNYQDFSDLHPTDITDIWMSQDHVISLLFGLSLVNSMVDGAATDGPSIYYPTSCIIQPYDPGAGPKLRDQAKRIADRLVTYVGTKNSNWHIVDPCSGAYIGPTRGGDAQAYSYAFAETGCIAAKNSMSLHQCSFCTYPIISCNNYHNLFSETFGVNLWQSVSTTPGTTPDVAVQKAELAASCNCIYNTILGTIVDQIIKVISYVWKWLGIVLGSVLQTVVTYLAQSHIGVIHVDNGTNDGMRPNVNTWDLDYAPFARALIHNDYPSINKPENHYNLPGLLDQAPCEGPWNLTSFTGTGASTTVNQANYPSSAYEWSSDTRVEHPERRGIALKNPVPLTGDKFYDIVRGEYNGLDYMLYHNLWYLYRAKFMGTPSGVGDLSDRLIAFPIPLFIPFVGTVGTSTSPLELDAFESIVADNTIGSNGNTTYRAGKWIQHTTNFHVSAGANFHSFIAPFNCSSSGNYQRQAASNHTTTKPVNTDYIGTDMGMVKTHKVDYPPEVTDYSTQPPVTIDNSAVVKNQLNQATPNYQQALTNAIVKSNIEENELMILPNPTNGVFRVKLPSTNKSNTMNIWVYNMSGNLVANKDNVKKWPETEDLDVSEYGAGTYMLRILTENGKSYTRKLIVK